MAETARQELERLRAEAAQVSPARRELNLLRSLSQVDTSPVQPPPVAGAGLNLGPRESYLRNLQNPTPEEQDLASQGIDPFSGAPVSRFQSGFAQNEALRIQDLQQRLNSFYSEKLGRPIEVQLILPGSINGSNELEFIDPETNRRTLVDELATTGADVAESVAPALPVAGAVVGGLAGLAVGSPNIGAGVGGAIGEGLRRGIGTALGVREEPFSEASKGVIGTGVSEGVLSKGGESAVKLGRYFKRIFKPELVSPEAAERILAEAEESQAIADRITEITKRRFQPRTSQMSGDPDLLTADEIVRTDKKLGPGIRRDEAENVTTLEAMFNRLNPQGDVESTTVGRGIQNEARRQTQPRVGASKVSVEGRVELLERVTSELPVATDPAIRQQLSDQATESLRILKKDFEDPAWDRVRKTMGYNEDTALSKVDVPIDAQTRRTLNQLTAEANQAIGGDVAAGKRALLPDGITRASADLNQLNVHIGSLKRRLRLAAKDEVITDPTGRDIVRVLSDLENTRNTFLRRTNPELLEQILEAESLTATRHRLFDKNIVGKLIRKENGAYEITDKSLIAEALGSGDKEAIEHLVSAFDNHPAGLPTLQKSFLAFYRNQVVSDGVPDAAAHKVFMRNHGATLDELFPGDNVIRTLGEFEKQVARSVKRFENFQKAVDNSFRGRIIDLAPERVADDFFKAKFTVKDAGRIMGLAKSAGYDDAYRQAIGNQMRTRFVSETTGIQLNSLSKFIDNQGPKLSKVFGPQYILDMKTLLKGLQTIKVKGSGIQTVAQPTLLSALAEGFARVTIARPLSPGGVALTRAKKLPGIGARNAMHAILTDPEALRAIVANRNRPLQNEAVARALGIVGGSSLLDLEDNFGTSITETVIDKSIKDRKDKE